MTCTAPGRRRRFYPDLSPLESRSLLTAVITSIGQDGQDLVGPDASQGSDGIQDLHLHLSGLSAQVGWIAVAAPGGFQWATAPDPAGAALAEYFPSSTPGQGDLYLNPQVKSNLAPPGGWLPLGGSTGNLIQLKNGVNLSVTITDQGQTNAQTVAVAVANLASATQAMPPVATPANPVAGFLVTDEGQDGTGQPYEQGYVHLVATAPAGVTLTSAGFSAVVWRLSDQAGLAWDSTNATLGHNHIYASLRTGSSKVVDLYFAPERNEVPVSGSSWPTLTLGVVLPNDPGVHVTRFMGGDWDPSARTDPINLVPPPYPAPATEAQLRLDLASTSPEYDTIELAANATIVITQPLEITHSVKIIGNHATLLFQQGNTASWPATASGAIYVDAPTYTNIQLDLSDFTIRFDTSAPIRWSNPAGAGPALYDPNNNPAGVQHAVIDTRDSTTNLNMTLLRLNGMTVLGPPAFDGASYSRLQAQLRQQGDATDQYVGEQDIDLIRTNDQDTGSIVGSTFQGGSIELFSGPWTITGNTVLGSTPLTYSPGAFGLHSPHDVLLEGNAVSQTDPSGHEFRLVVLAVSGFNNAIQGNSFGGGAGQQGNELNYSAATGQFGGINDPEVILAESSYGVLFEGRPGAISSDGQLLVLPNLRASAYAGSTGPGLVVSILAGVNRDGSPDLSLAGQWYRVAQQVSLSADHTIELLMDDPLPPMPQGGYYIVEVTSGFVNNSFSGNSIDLTGKSSTGITLNGADYGSHLVGNTFKGGSIYDTVYTGTAINLGAAIASAPSGSGPFPLPAGWTALPNLGTVVDQNTIEDSIGGIVIGVQHAVNYWGAIVATASETGRVFVTATVSRNTFAYDASFLSSWASSYVAEGNDPAQTSRPPTVTIGGGFSAEAPGPYGSPRFPWTVGNAIQVNGNRAPIFVDPVENVVAVQGNSVELLTGAGAAAQSPVSGQVYAGIINGVIAAPTVVPTLYNGLTYYPFNLNNLDVSAQPSGTAGVQAVMIGQDDVDVVGAGSGAGSPDGIQDLHLGLTGLDPSATIATIRVTGTAAGEVWQYPSAGSSPQIALRRAAGSSTADLYLEPVLSHLDDRFTILLSFAGGGSITVPVPGVRVSSGLAEYRALAGTGVIPPAPPDPPGNSVPAIPLAVNVSLTGLNQINLAWQPSAGASWYIVQMSLDGQSWTTIAGAVTSTSLTETGLAYATTYDFRVLAASGAGTSPASAAVTVATMAQQDLLSAQSLTINVTKKRAFRLPVAGFTDANTAATAASFVATIKWGDGRSSVAKISGGNGTFVITGAHKYAKTGVYKISVMVTMKRPGHTNALARSAARVVNPVKPQPSVKRLSSHLKQAHKAAIHRIR